MEQETRCTQPCATAMGPLKDKKGDPFCPPALTYSGRSAVARILTHNGGRVGPILAYAEVFRGLGQHKFK